MSNSFENPKKFIKDAVVTTMLAAGVFAGHEVQAGNGQSSAKAGIETLKQEHVLRDVSVKQLKKIVEEYTESPGSMMEMYLDKHKDDSFTVAEATGETQIAAKMAAEQKLKAEGKTSQKVLIKNLENHSVSVILIAAE